MSKFLAVPFTVTLMTLMDGEAYVPNEPRQFTYYFRVPNAWVDHAAGDLAQQVNRVAQAMYNDLAAGFRAAEPNDLSYLAVLHTAPRLLTPQEVAAAPWLGPPRPPVWEPTNCVIVHDDGGYTKVTPAQFTAASDPTE
ncbi:MAG: hypothetical protein M3Z04_20575 [Chloroflexota bacterium]|nr:hypothetical protein [Chloroflexota bacterium]